MASTRRCRPVVRWVRISTISPPGRVAHWREARARLFALADALLPKSAISGRPVLSGRLTEFADFLYRIEVCRLNPNRVPGSFISEALLNQQIACKNHAWEFGMDTPEITNCQWRSRDPPMA